MNEFKEQGLPVTEGLEAALGAYYPGLKRVDGEKRQDGTRKPTEGKAPMPFKVYKRLCQIYIRKGKFMAWSYITMDWNLIGRTGSVAAISLPHLIWLGDCLGVYIPTSKTDLGLPHFFSISSVIFIFH